MEVGDGVWSGVEWRKGAARGDCIYVYVCEEAEAERKGYASVSVNLILVISVLRY